MKRYLYRLPPASIPPTDSRIHRNNIVHSNHPENNKRLYSWNKTNKNNDSSHSEHTFLLGSSLIETNFAHKNEGYHLDCMENASIR
jgi:hypothetical protein